MTDRELHAFRAAAMRAVEAFFDELERHRAVKANTRPVAQPSSQPSELDRARALRILETR